MYELHTNDSRMLPMMVGHCQIVHCQVRYFQRSDD